MNRQKLPSPPDAVPYLKDLVSFYKHINARPPLDSEFDIREINPDVLTSYDHVANPFRHSFYCITLLLDGDVTLSAGFWKTKLSKPALYFKTPYQVVSWIKPERWIREYFIVFTESFLQSYRVLADTVFALPFFDMDKAIPFEIEPDEVAMLAGLYQQILHEYQSNHPDRFELIASYTHALLIHIRRLYVKYAETDTQLTNHIHQAEHSLVERFRTLVRQQIVTGNLDQEARTIRHFASALATHPNHLNAVVKRQTQRTAIAFVHEQLALEAQTLLNQTELSIKEIAFRLGFHEPSHFNHFFKKQTQTTPAVFRKDSHRSF